MNGIRKVIRDGMVAVLYSPGFGAGWYSWNSKDRQILYSPELVDAIESGKRGSELKIIAKQLFPDVYEGGAGDLQIEWLPQGTAFEIDEYDGSESVRTLACLTEIA